MKRYIFCIALLPFFLSSCFKEIDTEPIPLPELEEFFTLQHSIKENQIFYRLYENTGHEVQNSKNTIWDLAFESAGSGSRILLGWASFSTGTPTGLYDFDQLDQDLILDLIDNGDWEYDDPTFINTPDSLALTSHWENGEIWIQNRGTSSDNYYAIQFISSDPDSYTFKYASATSLGEVKEATVYRSSAYNYVYFSYEDNRALLVEPDYREWDLLFTPYRGWWETSDPGVFAPFNLSGVMINNEAGVRVAQVFDPDVSFEELSLESFDSYEFTDKKGVIGADWKVLGAAGGNIGVDPDKKYLLKKTVAESGEVLCFKLQIIDYYLNSEKHFPTVEFKYLGSE